MMETIYIKPTLEAFIKANTETARKNHFVMTPETMRESSRITAKKQELPKLTMAKVVDSCLDVVDNYAVPIRIYVPSTERPLPVFIYYHGGGFVIDSIEVYDPICRRLAKTADCIVISPDYRLAPEYKYPAAEVDALAVAQQALTVLNRLAIAHTASISVGGDSAGGYLAAKVSMAAQSDPALLISHQILIYPLLDLTGSFPSYITNGIERFGSQKEKMDWYVTQYADQVTNQRDISPVFGTVTSRMPATMVVTVQSCPFRDEGQYYAKRLVEVGVSVEVYQVENMVHSYLNFEKICIDEIDETYLRIASFLKNH